MTIMPTMPVFLFLAQIIILEERTNDFIAGTVPVFEFAGPFVSITGTERGVVHASAHGSRFYRLQTE